MLPVVLVILLVRAAGEAVDPNPFGFQEGSARTLSLDRRRLTPITPEAPPSAGAFSAAAADERDSAGEARVREWRCGGRMARLASMAARSR